MRDYQDKERNRFYKKMNDEQKELFHSIQDNIFTFCEAKSGTVKTTVPSAALVSNNFMEKYESRQPYYIVIDPTSSCFIEL